MSQLTYDQFVARFLSIREQLEGMRRDYGEDYVAEWADKQLTTLVDEADWDYYDAAEAEGELKAWIESLSDVEHAWYFGLPEWQEDW